VLKSFPAQIATLTRHRAGRRNLRILLRFVGVLLLLITVYTVVFHLLMLREGQEHTWLTGLYWTLTVMSTLGFGDITFQTDLGRLFSILVLLSGMVFLLILLPFTFIEFFYEPWMKAQVERRAPRRVDDDVSGHVIVTSVDAVTSALVRRLEGHGVDHLVLTATGDEARTLQDRGFLVAVGAVDDPETWRKIGVERAALVLTTGSDVANSNIAFQVREVSPSVPIVTTAHSESSVDVLQLAGSTHVLRLEQLIGEAFARRVLGGDTRANVIGHVEGILVAEAPAHGTPLVGKTLAECRLREQAGVAVAGVWQRGRFEPGRATTKIDSQTVLVLVGSKHHLQAYNQAFGRYAEQDQPVLILGGGRVGRATAKALGAAGLDYRIVDKDPDRIQPGSKRHFLGDAAAFEVLEVAGIRTTQSIVITTHDDDVNVFLTLYCRKLRPEAQILARSTFERSVGTLHRAGADVVLSYASMGANVVFNLMRRGEALLLAEGLDVVRVRVPRALVGRTVATSGIRERTGCSIVTLRIGGEMSIVPSPEAVLEDGSDLLLVGAIEAHYEFVSLYPDAVIEAT
jgi:voltage-gated potassium channel